MLCQYFEQVLWYGNITIFFPPLSRKVKCYISTNSEALFYSLARSNFIQTLFSLLFRVDTQALKFASFVLHWRQAERPSLTLLWLCKRYLCRFTIRTLVTPMFAYAEVSFFLQQSKITQIETPVLMRDTVFFYFVTF